MSLNSDQALDQVRAGMRALQGLVGHVPIAHLVQTVEPEVMVTALATALEAADLLEKLDAHLKRGGDLPSDWYQAGSPYNP